MAHSLAFPASSPYVQSQAAPWRGSFVVTGMRATDRNSTQQVYVTAVETDGERMDLWPYQFFAFVKYNSALLREFVAWSSQNNPPTCTFIPTHFTDANSNALNQSNFRSLSRILFETQTVAIASWNVDAIPGAGIIIYPAQNSTAMLVGALFLHSPFPEFILGMPQSVRMNSSMMPQHRQLPYSQAMGSGSRYSVSHPRQSASPESSNTNSPVDHYQYMIPQNMGIYPGQAQSSMAGTWNALKTEDGVIYSYPRSQDHARYT